MKMNVVYLARCNFQFTFVIDVRKGYKQININQSGGVKKVRIVNNL